MAKFVRIGENLNVMSKVLGPAMKERNAGPIQDMAKRETAKGVDYIDLNIGPARKGGAEMMEWVVKTVQEVSDLPLALDTTNLDAMEAGLKVAKRQPLINSVTLQSDRFEAGLKLAAKYKSGVVAVLWSDTGMPVMPTRGPCTWWSSFRRHQSWGSPWKTSLSTPSYPPSAWRSTR